SAGTDGIANTNEGAGGGGAGGTIVLSAATARGAGTLHARGGAGGGDSDGGNDPGGGGGAGRITVSVTGYNASTLTYSVSGGSAGGGTAAAGSGGTAYPQPGGITDLAGSLVSTGLAAAAVTVNLTWTAPAPGAAGALNNYDIRWATFPLTSMAFYNIAPFASVRSTSLVAGVRQSTAIASIDPLATWYFAITVSDLQSLRSDLSNAATALAYVRVYGAGSGNGQGLAAGDVDGDGDVDLVQTRFNDGVHRWSNDGALAFTDGGSVAGTFNEARQVSLGDKDRDGDLDAAVANYTGNPAQVLANDGAGAFALSAATAAGENYGVAWGDFNNDGLPDFAAAKAGTADDYVARNNGDGTFSTITLVGTAGNSLAVAWADADQDGDLDLAIANDSAQNEVYVRNDGNGAFSTFTLAGTGGNSTALAWGDADGDGDLDLAVANSAQDPVLVRNDGGGSFTVLTTFSGFGSGGSGLAWGDMDGDGDADLLVSYSNGADAVFRNDGASFVKLTLPGTGGNSQTPVWADLDGDGDLDVAVTTASARQFAVLRNDASVTASSPSAPSSGMTASWSEDSVGSASGTLTLSWSAASDATTPAASLLYRVRVGTSSGGSEYLRVPPANSERGRSRVFPDRLSAGSPGVRVSSVPKGVPYYWAVLAEDAGYVRGSASSQQTADLTAPSAPVVAAAQDAVVETSSVAWVAVTFNAPGENGAAGDLQSGALYDLRWSSAGTLDTTAKYAAAPYAQTFSAAGTAGAAVTLKVAVDPGKTWHFALTAKDSLGVRSALSNAVSASARLVREQVVDAASFSLLQGQTTAFLRVKLWTEGSTADLLKVKVRKFGTLPDAAVSNVALYEDNPADGLFTAADVGQLTNPTVFVSSQATLTLGAADTLTTSTKTYFVVATLRSNYLPVAGASISMRLDGEAVTVRGAGFEGVDFPAFSFDGVDDAVTVPYAAALDVGGGGQVTVEAWLRSTDTARANAAVVTRGINAGNNGYRLWLNAGGCAAGVPSFFVGSSVLCAANGAGQVSVTDGRWHHVAAVYSALVGQFFIDGVALTTGAMAGTLADPISYLAVGSSNASGGAANFLGELDEVRVSNFVRYPAELPPVERGSAAGSVFLYHFDGLDAESMVRDASANNLHGTPQGGVFGYARSTGSAVNDTGDTLFSAVTPLVPSAFFRNDQNDAVLKLQLWTGGDFITLDALSVAATGSAQASSVNQIKFYLDNGDGLFSVLSDTALTVGQSFSLGKATFNLSGAGNSQLLDASTKTYFLAWNVSVGASLGADMGAVFASTADFVFSGAVDAMSPASFPLASGTAPIVAAQSLVSAETLTGTWLNVSSAVFRAAFGSGNIDHLHWRWDQSPATSVTGAEVPQWSSGKTTVTATSDAQNWYFHARAYDTTDGAGTQTDIGPFWFDRTAPTGASFLSYGSTVGPLAESQFNDLASGVTVQLTVSDAASGLNLAGPAPLSAGSGAAGLWHLDEAAGPWADALGTNTVAAVGTPLVGPGRFGPGLLLDGLAYAEKGTFSGLPLGSSARTLEAWVNQSSTAGVQGVAYYGQTSCSGGVTLALSSGVVMGGDGCVFFTAGGVLSTGAWHHVALTYDGSNIRLYADGAFLGSNAYSLVTAAGPLRLGQTGAGTQGLKGLLDEVKLSTHALVGAQVASHAGAGEPFSASYSSDAGRTWETIASTDPADAAHVSLTGAHGTTAAQTLTATGLRFVVSTGTLTGAAGTNLVRFHYADVAGNVRTSGPFTVIVDTNAAVAFSTPSLPAAGTYALSRPDFYWTAPSSSLVQGLGGQFFLEVSSGDPSFTPPVVISISTPAVVSDARLSKVTGVYLSTFTLAEGATYYWRVRSRSSLGLFGGWGPAAGFVVDTASPSAAGFAVFNSTGGVFGEAGPLDLLLGVTAQMTVSDGVAGLGRAPTVSSTPATIAYWRFSERQGSAPVDDAGGIVGTLTCSGGSCSPARYGLTPFGAGLRLSGNQYMSAPNTSFAFPAGSTFTVSAWIRPVSVTASQVIAAVGAPNTGNPNGGNWAFSLNSSGQLGATNITGGGVFANGAPLLAGAWQHVTMVTDASRVWFYVNGALRGASNWSGNSGGGAMPFTVGAGVNVTSVVSGQFSGDLDEVRVQSAALTPAEVADEFARSAPGYFAVEYSTSAGQAWNVVSATFAAAGLPFVAQTGVDGTTGSETLSVRNLTLAQSTSIATGSLGTNLLRFMSADRRGNFTTAGPFTVVVDTVAAAAVSTPTLPAAGVYVSTRPTFLWAGPSTATALGMGAAASFLLEVDDSSDFLSPVILVSTPVVATASSSLVTQGVYVSTFTLASGTTYFWRVRAQDYLGLYSPALTTAAFVTDFSTPTGSGFGTVSSTGGLVGEAVGISLLSGVTAQATVRDLGPSGLALDAPDGVAAFGVMYSTSAGAEWIDGARGRALTMTGKTGVTSMVRHGGKLWAANVGRDVWSFDGSAWGISNTFAAVPNALESFGGKLYAALASGQVWQFDGASWTQAAALTGGSVRALRAFAGRLYAGDDSGRVWAYEPAADRWYVAFQSASAVIESLGVYDGRLFVGANPSVYVFNGTSWDVSFSPSAAVNAFAAYDNKLFAATNNSGIIYQFDGASWTTSVDPAESDALSLAVHAGRLYAGLGNPSNGRLYAFDGRGWSVIRTLPTSSDRFQALAAYGGRLYEGQLLASGDAAVDVSTPLAVVLTGAEATTAAQTLSVTDLSLTTSAVSSVCNGALSCTATNMVRFTYSDRGGRVGQAGPFAILADSLLSQPTTYAPADGRATRDTLPDFSWVEAGVMPKHVVQLSTASDFSTLQSLNPAQPTTNGYYGLTSPSLTSGTTYYWRVQGQSSLLVGSAFSVQSAFLLDTAPPSTSSYRHLNSTGGALSEGQMTNLASGATFELTLQDPLSGLYPVALESGARLGAYSFEGAGAPVLDASGRGNTALLGNTALRSAAGLQGGGLSFSAATTGLTVSTVAAGSWTGLTAAAWVKMTADAQSNKTIAASKHFRLQAYSASGRVRYQLDPTATGGCALATPSVYPLGGWVHVAAVLDPSSSVNRLFVNGVTAASCPGNAALSDTAFTVGIDTVSGIGANDAFAGLIDEVRLFSAALSTAQVQSEMNGSPLAAYFSTDAGVTWSAAASTHAAGPHLAFSAAPGSTAAELFRAVDLPLRESTNTLTCASVSPCGATNQVQLRMPDRAGSVRTMGPFAVIVDTSGPAPLATSLTPLATDQLLVTSTATDNLAGVKDFSFEASSSALFALPVSSSGFVAQTTWTFTGLLDATTYFVRIWSRDQVLNVSTPSVSLATATFGTVTLTTAAAAPASALQGGLVPMARLYFNTKPGSTSRLKTLTVRKTGTALDSEVSQARVYVESDGDGVFSGGDTLQASAALTLNEALLTLAGGGPLIDVAVSTFHVVFSMSQDAFTNRTVGLEISSATSVGLQHPGRAFGPFPVVQAAIPVSDGANVLEITPTSLAPLSAEPSTDDIPMLSLRAKTAVVATSVLSTFTLTLSGTLPPSSVRSVNVWRDADPEDGVFDAAVDTRMTGDTDNFNVFSTATIALSGFDVSSRTVTNSPRRYFVSLSLAGDAPQDATFQLKVTSTSHIGLENPVDTVQFITAPVQSSTVSVIFNNTLTAAFKDETPAAYTQGDRYAILRATLTVDVGSVQFNRFTVRRTGTGQDSDVSAVEVWRDVTADGKSLLPQLDQRIGTAAFSGGLANIVVTTQTLSANATNVFFIAYLFNPAAAPNVNHGARLLDGDVGVANTGTTILGSFPVDSSTRTVQATVNHMVVVNAIQDVSPGALVQGQQNVAMLRLDVVSDKNDFSWLGLTVERLGTAPDSAVSSINIYRDFDGNSLFDAAVDSRVTSGGDVFSASTAVLTLQQVQTLTSSTRTYFVTMTVAALATPGQTLGLRVSNSAEFNLLAPNTLLPGTTFPMLTTVVPVNQFQNTVTVTTASLVSGLGAEPGTSDVALIALTLKTDVSNADWTSLRVDQAGTAADPDVKAVKLYYDLNDAGTFDSGNLPAYAAVAGSTQSFGSNGSGSLILTFSSTQVLTPTAKRYFLVVDLSTGATPDRTVVVRASTGAFFAVNAPNHVDPNAGFQSPALPINAPPVTMYVTAGSSAPASAVQGTSNMTMLTLKARTNAYSARWTQLRVTRSGTGADSDVTAVKLYRDADADGALSVVSDERLSTGAFSGGTALLSFSTQTVTASTQTFFIAYDVKTTAVAGNSVGARVAAAGDLRIASPDSVSTVGFPLQSVNSTVTATQVGLAVTPVNLAPGELKQGATDQVLMSLSLNTTAFALTWSALTVRSTGSAADADIKAVSLWHDANLNGSIDFGTDTKITSGLNAFLGGTAVLSLSVPQEIGTSIKRYLVAADIASFAEPGRTFAVILPSTSAFSVSAPNFVVNANFPAQSDANATLRKLEESLVVTPADLVTTGINQGSLKALARLDARASRNRVAWTGLVVRQNGNLGAGEIDTVGVWRDSDADGAVTGADFQVGTAAFSGSLATVVFSSAQTVGIATQSYLLAAQPNISATVGADIRLSVQSADFSVTSPDAVSSSSLPFTAGSAVVLDAKTPSQPVVTDAGGYSGDFEGLDFSWVSTVGTGTIVGASYAVGTTPGGVDVRGWTALAANQTSVRAVGFALLQATTYYVSVKTQSSFGIDSPVGRSDGVLMDFSPPARPAPTVTAGSGALLVTWGTVAGGPSGILGYLVEYRTGASPQWFNAKTGVKTTVSAAGASVVETVPGAVAGSVRLLAVSTATLVQGASFQASGLPTGTLQVRVRSVTGSGVLSAASDPVQVQLGALPKDGLSDASVYPNPFDSRKQSANIHFVLAAASEVSIKVYTVYGRTIREASFSGVAGSNTTTWDGADQDGRKVGKGLYVMVLQSGGAKAILKVGVIH
ncbi:T9SS type A sorting domain-containing protein, partial [bacterium]